MFQWFFLWRYKRKLRKQLKNADFKMKEAGLEMKSNALQEIDLMYERDFQELEAYKDKLNTRLKKFFVIMSDTDDFGVAKQRKNPPFTENEIQSMKSQNILYKLILFIFIVSEMFLYYLTGEVLAPGNIIFKIAVAILFSIITMLLINFSLTNHFKYIEAKKRKEELELKKEDISIYNQKRFLGYLFFIFALAIILAAGYIRMTYLHTIDLSAYSEAERQAIEKMNFWVTVLVFAVTFALAIYLAFLKSLHSKNINDYRVYKKWKFNNAKIKGHSDKIKNIKERFENSVKLISEKYWQLLFEFRKIFGREYDDKNETLAKEYDTYKQNGGVLDDKNYQKFSDIQSYDEEIFKYGIYENEKTRNYNLKINEGLKVVSQVESEIKNFGKNNSLEK